MSRKKGEAQKLLEGTSRRDRHNQLPPNKTDPITPPDYLTERGKEIFANIVDHLEEAKLLYQVDGHLIGQLAQWLYVFEHASNAINYGESYINISENTDRVTLNGYVQAMDKCRTNIGFYCKELGIGIKSREKLDSFSMAPSVGEKGDPIRDLLLKGSSKTKPRASA